MITLLVYSLIPLVIGVGHQIKKINMPLKKIKLKSYKLKQSRSGVYVVLGIFLAFEMLFAYIAFFTDSKSVVFYESYFSYFYHQIFGFLLLTAFFGILFIPSIIIVYRKLVDIEIDSEKLVVIRQGKREEIKFKNTNIIKLRGAYTEEFTPFKTPILLIRGNTSMDIKLSNYPSKGIYTFKNMLYTYAGDKFKDKKVV